MLSFKRPRKSPSIFLVYRSPQFFELRFFYAADVHCAEQIDVSRPVRSSFALYEPQLSQIYSCVLWWRYSLWIPPHLWQRCEVYSAATLTTVLPVSRALIAEELFKLLERPWAELLFTILGLLGKIFVINPPVRSSIAKTVPSPYCCTSVLDRQWFISAIQRFSLV